MQSLPIPTASAAAAAADEVMPADGAGAIQSGGLSKSGEARGKHVFSHSPILPFSHHLQSVMGQARRPHPHAVVSDFLIFPQRTLAWLTNPISLI